MRLAPCPHCHRHVRVSEAACPFCGAHIGEVAVARPPVVPSRTLGRAAIFAFGSAIATSAPGCYLSHERGAGPIDTVDASQAEADTGSGIAPPYGAPPIDASPAPSEADAGAPITLYGGPFPEVIDAGPVDEDAGGGNQVLYGGPGEP